MITSDPSSDGERGSGTLYRITPEEISAILGFEPNRVDDKDDGFSWGFAVDGVHCGIWSWHGSYRMGMFSTSGPRDVLAAVFGDHVRGE